MQLDLPVNSFLSVYHSFILLHLCRSNKRKKSSEDADAGIKTKDEDSMVCDYSLFQGHRRLLQGLTNFITFV